MFNKVTLFIFIVLTVGCSGNKGKNYSCLDDAATDKIGVLMGSTQDTYITKNFPQATGVINLACAKS